MEKAMEKELMQQILKQIGVEVQAIYTNECKEVWNYLYRNQLKHNYPMIFIDQSAVYLMLPWIDCSILEEGELSVKEYIKEATFTYALFWNVGVYKNVFTFRIKKEKFDISLMRRYLILLKCVTQRTFLLPRLCREARIEECPNRHICPSEIKWNYLKRDFFEEDIREEVLRKLAELKKDKGVKVIIKDFGSFDYIEFRSFLYYTCMEKIRKSINSYSFFETMNGD